MKKTPIRRKSKSATSKLQTKCDSLLTPIIKERHPVCLLNGLSDKCTYNTEVAHHHVHKSKSLILRYELDNLIPLCQHCHLMLHHNESYWASKIVEIRGLDWFRELERKKNQIVKANKAWYEEKLEALTNL
jgi:5-methylcytosine-specific restriction endonuclease McrA